MISSASHRKMPRTLLNKVVAFNSSAHPSIFASKGEHSPAAEEDEPAVFTAEGDEPPKFDQAWKIVFSSQSNHLIVVYILATAAASAGGTDIVSNSFEWEPPKKLPDKFVALCQILFSRPPTHLIVEFIPAAKASEGGAVRNTSETPIVQRAGIMADAYRRKPPRKPPNKVVDLIIASEGDQERIRARREMKMATEIQHTFTFLSAAFSATDYDK